MADRPPTTDLRGGKTSEDSFTRLMANLVVAYVVDFQSDLLSDAALGSTVRPEGPGRLLWSLPVTGRIWLETVSGSVSHERCLDVSSRIKLFTYCLIPDHGRSRDWALAKSRYQFEDLGLILWDVVLPDWLCPGFRWDQSRS